MYTKSHSTCLSGGRIYFTEIHGIFLLLTRFIDFDFGHLQFTSIKDFSYFKGFDLLVLYPAGRHNVLTPNLLDVFPITTGSFSGNTIWMDGVPQKTFPVVFRPPFRMNDHHIWVNLLNGIGVSFLL